MDLTVRNDIVTFGETLFTVDRCWIPDGAGGWRVERNRPIVLFDWQRQQLREVFPPANGGRPVVMNYLDSECKKLGKSTKAGVVAAYMAVTEPGGEVFICAADKDQARDRVFKSIRYAVEHGPLGDYAVAYRDRIDFSNSATITALPMDAKGAAGPEPVCVIFDELHTYTWESERRLWDEMIIPPTLDYGIRWVASYAGFTGESVLLQEVWDRVMAGECVQEWPPIYHNDKVGWWGMILQGEEAYQLVPWGQGERGRKYLEIARDSERPLSYRRLFCNLWVSSESAFCPAEWWEACEDPALRPLSPTKDVMLYVGVDAAVKPGGDDAATIALYRDPADNLVKVAWHKVWRGGKARRRELRLDKTLEPYLEHQHKHFRLAKVSYDPRFMVNVAARLRDKGLPMVEVPQSRLELGPRGQGLYSLVQDGGLRYYSDKGEELKSATAGAVAKDIPQGLHIIKGVGKVDLLVAMSFPILDVVDPSPPPAGEIVELDTSIYKSAGEAQRRVHPRNCRSLFHR